MEQRQEIFAAKLDELETQYGQMLQRLRLSQQANQEELHSDMEQMLQEYRKYMFWLQQKMENGRSQAVKVLARNQYQYFKNTEELLRQELPCYLHSEGSDEMEDQAEAVALYAEDAMDFAGQAFRCAMFSAMNAMELQLNVEKRKEKQG